MRSVLQQLHLQELEEQARMLGGALTALSAREEALRTARTLDDDLGRMRARSESMQASGNPKAVCFLWTLTLRIPLASIVLCFVCLLMCFCSLPLPFDAVACDSSRDHHARSIACICLMKLSDFAAASFTKSCTSRSSPGSGLERV